jgi:glycosyltransferase involved in cell wall biosynthesis
MSVNVAMIDLLTQTPFYDRYLAEAVAPLVDEFTLYAIRFHHEPDYFDDVTFERSPGLIDWRGGLQFWGRPLRRAGKMIGYGLNWLFLLRRFREQPPDIVHIEWLSLLSRTRWELGLVERLQRLAIPILYTVHDYLPHRFLSDVHGVYRDVYATVDHLIVHTQTDRRRLIEQFDVPEEKVTVIPQGPVFFEQNDFDREQARATLGLERDDFIFLMLGVIRPYKGIEEAVRALAQVVKEGAECTLVVVGNVLDRQYLQRLKTLADELVIQSRIRWHTEYTPSSQIGIFHAAADVVLFPYRDISQSGAFLTAAGLGKCTLTTAVGGLAEIVLDGETGVQIASEDPDAIAAGMWRCFGLSRQEREAMGKSLQDFVVEFCNWSLIARRTVELYDRIVC